MKKTKGWLHSPWVIGIGTTIISFILTLLYDLYKKNHLFSAVSSVSTFIYNSFLSIMNFEIKVWILIIVITLAILFIYILYKVDSLKKPIPDEAKFLTYTQGKINGWSWKWTWEKDYYGKYHLENLYPVCLVCETPLIKDSAFSGTVKCPRCPENTARHLPDMEPIRTLIIDNANRGLF